MLVRSQREYCTEPGVERVKTLVGWSQHPFLLHPQHAADEIAAGCNDPKSLAPMTSPRTVAVTMTQTGGPQVHCTLDGRVQQHLAGHIASTAPPTRRPLNHMIEAVHLPGIMSVVILPSPWVAAFAASLIGFAALVGCINAIGHGVHIKALTRGYVDDGSWYTVCRCSTIVCAVLC